MVVQVQRSPDISDHVTSEGTGYGTVTGVHKILSSTMMGMQHKLPTSWKNAYNSDYPVMAEDGRETGTTTSAANDISSNNSAGSIVNGLLRRANGFGDSLGGGGGLEQKIQELRAEKEAGELKKCHTSGCNDQDSPLDFSVKRRSSFSGSLTDDSQASSSSPSHVTDYTTVSPPADSGHSGHVDDFSKRATPSPERTDDHKDAGQPGVGAPPVTAMPPLLNGMGMFPGLPSSLMANGSAINTFSQMAAAAAFMDPRNKKSNRPFKAYPKEALQMPLGFFGIPNLTSAAIQQGVDSGLFSGMSSEELINLYNQQLQMFREKQITASGVSGKTSPPSQMPAANGNNSSNHHHHHHPHHQQPHHHQQPQQQHHHNHRLPSPSLPHAPTASSRSPPHATPEHAKPSFPTTASINATLVSSTSSSLTPSGSRKRPRSLPDDQKDAAYWERRRKNNDAAKRSRDARRAKEDEIAIRAALLEQENIKLRVEVAALKTETARLRCLLYNS